MADRSALEALGNKAGSVFKTLAPSIEAKKAATSPVAGAVTEVKEVTPTEGFSRFPVVQSATITAADFYRRGRQAEGQTPGTPISYDVQPRAITEFSSSEEPASIRLVGKLKKGTKTEDQDLIPPYTKFFLESVSEAHQERSQVVETFGEFYVFFFGERPPVYTFAGTLMNTKYANWTQDFMFYYDKFLRGTKSVENNARIVLTYGGRQIEGFILGVSTQTAAQSENGTQFSFQVLVIDRKVLQLSADFGLVESNGQFNSDASFLGLLSKFNLSRPEISKAWNTTKGVMDKTINPAAPTIPTSSDATSLALEYGKKLIPSSFGGIKLG